MELTETKYKQGIIRGLMKTLALKNVYVKPNKPGESGETTADIDNEYIVMKAGIVIFKIARFKSYTGVIRGYGYVVGNGDEYTGGLNVQKELVDLYNAAEQKYKQDKNHDATMTQEQLYNQQMEFLSRFQDVK